MHTPYIQLQMCIYLSSYIAMSTTAASAVSLLSCSCPNTEACRLVCSADDTVSYGLTAASVVVAVEEGARG